MRRFLKRVLFLALVVGAGVGIYFALKPQPVPVETARAVRGPLRVTVDQEGETRARDRFVIAAPVSGQLSRIELREGDLVTPASAVATISPLPLDPKETAQATARVQAAEALRREADQREAHARADLEQARRDLDRARKLVQSGDIAQQAFERAQVTEKTANTEVEAARRHVQAAEADVQAARAALIALDSSRSGRIVTLRPPVTGRVLRIPEKSERVVQAGTQLLILGDPRRLEIVIDVLSTDAVKIRPGAAITLENWGGTQPIRARVRTIEPYAFTKISALGIEEQRVNIIADFVDPPGPLGDAYRVEARIVIWEEPDVLKIPSGALFRSGENWKVFGVEQERAVEREVKVGRRSATETQIAEGLCEGDTVILHPSGQVAAGVRVAVARAK